MNIKLSAYATSRDNNFNLIRFVAASLVLVSHSYTLALGRNAAEPLRSAVGMTWGEVAVDVFFVTSGFLITSSFFSKNNIIAFIWARMLRIYPALIVSTLFCVFGVGLWFTTNSFSDYILDPQTYNYILKNSTLFFGIEYRLPGVFTDIPYKGVINGSLWTLPYEVKMYAILASILVLIPLFSKRWGGVPSVRHAILFIAVSALVIHTFNHFQPFIPEQFIRLFSMFIVGSMVFIWQNHIFISTKVVAICFFSLIVSTIDRNLFFIIYSFTLPYYVFYLAYAPSGGLRKFNNHGDYSYGMYIYAFPIQQSIMHIFQTITVPTLIFLSFLITLTMAMISWHIIEYKFLKMKNLYIYLERLIKNTS